MQAIARDVLWEVVRKMEAAGYRVVHHVHDEVIAAVLCEHGTEALNFAVKSLQCRPKWAPGCPMDGEGLVTDRYGGH